MDPKLQSMAIKVAEQTCGEGRDVDLTTLAVTQLEELERIHTMIPPASLAALVGVAGALLELDRRKGA